MKKIITLLLLICLTSGIIAQNHFYDTEVVDANGNTLYFLLNDDLVTASVTYPNLYTSSPWDGYTKPTGSVVIPSSVDIYGYDYPVTRVDDHAFDGCSGITAITLPPQLTNILTYAFRNCTGITSITFPNTLCTIGEYGFYGCTGLTSISLPPLVSHVSNYVFYGCTNLSTALINDVHTIGNYAFKNCTSLATVSMNSVTNIGNYSFESDAVLNNVTLPNSLLTIGEYAFHSCTSLSSIAIPKNVTQIGNRAFQGCTLLTNLQFNATRCMTMGSSSYPVFDGCNHINNLTIGSNVRRIPDFAFKNATGSISSVNIPDSVLYIGKYSFQSCSGLQSVTIGRGVDSIGQNAFTSCTSMTTVSFNADSCRWVGGSPNTTSGDNGRVFYGDNLFTTLNIGNNVKVIPDNLFNDCSHIANITIPNSVVCIGNYAFYSCDGATSLSLGSGLRSIGGCAFASCSHIPSIITQGNDLQTIGHDAFSGCTAANTISVNAYTIDYYAFTNCMSAASVTSGNISVNAQTIGDHAFSGCSKATTISVDAQTIGTYAFNGCLAANTISVEAYSIGNYAFKNCTSAASVTSGNISVNAQTIGTEAFYGCSKADTISVETYTIGNSAFRNCTSAASVMLGNSTHTIVQYAFYNCSTLPSITIPAAVDSMGYRAFGGCAQLTQVNFNADSCSYMSPDGVFQGTPVSRVVVGNGVKNIPDYAFQSLTSLSQVVFSSTVKRIGSYSFKGCTGLRAPTLSSQLTTIEEYAFSGCNNLAFASIMIPANVKRIGNYAFQNCSNLQRVVFMAQNCIEMGSANSPVFSGCNNLVRLVTGNGVTNIPDHAFRGVSSLHSPLLVPTIQNIGDYAFYGCSSIDTIWTRGETKTIGDYAFRGCTQAYVLILSDQIDSIGTYAFYQCSALPSIEIPNSVKFIGASAFQSCSILTSIYSKMRQIPSMSGDIFDNSTRSSATLTVPCNMTSRYRANSYWNFTTIQEDNNCQTSFLVSAIPNHTEWGSVMGSGIYSFGDTATLTAIPDSGYVFWKWDDGATANPRQIDVTDSMEFVAIFALKTVGARALIEYVFNAETKPYTSLFNATVISSITNKDDACGTITLPFDFPFGLTTFNAGSTLGVGSNGYLILGGTSTSTTLNGTSSSYNIINPIINSNAKTGTVYYQSSSDSVTIEYVGLNSKSSPYDNMNYQVRLYPSGIIQIHYGSNTHSNSNTYWRCFMREKSHNDFFYVTGSWNNPDGKVAAVSTPTGTPSKGLLYTFYPFGFDTTYNSGGETPIDTTEVPVQVTVTVNASPSACGTASGGGTYWSGDTITLTAIPEYGFRFVNWSDGHTENPYSYIVGNVGTSITAYFDTASFNVSITANNPEMGDLTGSGSGIYKYLRTLNFSAQPHEGYIFAGWNDGVTNPNRTVTVTRDTVIQALFADPNNLMIHDTTFITVPVHDTTFVDVPVHDTTYVSVHDTTFVPVHDTTYVTQFDTTYINVIVHDTTYVDVPYPVHDTTFVTQFDTTYINVTVHDTTYVTQFDTTYINVTVHDTTYVDVPYPVHDTTYVTQFDTTYINVPVHDTTYVDVYVTVHDTTFVDVPYPVHDTTYVTQFDTTYINVPVHDTTYVDVPYPVHDTTYVDVYITVHDTTYVDVFVPVHDTTYVDVPYPVHDTTYVTQFDTTYINVPVHDTTYVDVYVTVHDTTYVDVFVPVHDTTYVDVPYPVHDTTYVTQFDTIYVTHFDTVSVTLYDTTYITVHDTVTLQPDMYTITVYSNNLQYGLAAGNGEFPEGSVVEIAAIPIEGYHFEQWQDGNTQNPRSVTLTEDKTFIATFGTVGIASPELRTYEVYAVRNEIVVRNAAGSRVRIFDAKGSILSCEQSVLEEYRFPVLATGTYFVQVDNDSACKVVVVRQ